jgi:flagellar hook-associated protein 3 FlgL
MLVNTVLRDLFINNNRMIAVQHQIATGRIVNAPSEDPMMADQVIGLDLTIARATQYIRNGQAGNSFLALADSTMGEVNDLGNSARTLAIKMANETATGAMRGQAASEVQQLLEEAVSLADRRFRDRYIFSGYRTGTPPFEITGNGVLYHGDLRHIQAQLTQNTINQVSINGADAFNACDARVQGTVDLNPALDFADDGTRLRDLNRGNGVASGAIRLTYSGGTVDVDLASAETVEDVSALINAATGGVVTVSAGGAGNSAISLTDGGGGPLTVAEVNRGATARNLGILGSSGGAVLVGSDLNPLLTTGTKMSSLLNGGADLAGGFTITNGTLSDTFSGADLAGSVGDLLTRLNNSTVGVFAEINAAGTGLDIYSRYNGPTMTITENGGTTAADLGILEAAGVRADNMFTAMLDLRDALQLNDRAAVSATIGVFERAQEKLLVARAEVGARVQRNETISGRQEDERYNLTKLLSEINDADYSRVAMDFQNLRNIIEAALQVAAQTIPQSLVNFL